MNRTDKEQLIHIAGIIQDWIPSGTAVELEYVFMILNDIPQNKYLEQWQEIRTALNKNGELTGTKIRNNIRRNDFARQGYWWWDPSLW